MLVQNKKIYLNKFIFIYIILQPIVDILTALHENEGIFPFSIGIVFRSLFLVVAVLISFFVSLAGKNWKIIVWLASVIIYNLAYMVISFLNNPMDIVKTDITEMVKCYYFIYVLILFISIQKYLNKEMIIKALLIIGNIYTISLIIAVLTHTSYPAYRDMEVGNVGWFYAGNELSGIYAILIPIMLFSMILSDKYKKTMVVLSVCAVVATVLMGLRTPYLAIRVYLLLFILWGVVNCIIAICKKDGALKKKNKIILVKTIIVFAILVGIYNFSFTKINFDNHQEPVIEDTENEDQDESGFVPQNNERWKKLNSVLNNRLTYMAPKINEFTKASMSEKVIGIGYTHEEQGHIKTKKIEIDPLDTFFSHGYVGFLIVYIPLFYLMIQCIIRFFAYFTKNVESIQVCTYMYSFFIAIGIAFTAGHILVSPAVAIYVILAIFLVRKYYEIKKI